MADIILEIKIPSIHAARALDYLNKANEKCIAINIMELGSRWEFSYQPKQETENNKQYAERVISSLTRALMRTVDYSEDNDRYGAEINAITPPNQDVPDDIVQ